MNKRVHQFLAFIALVLLTAVTAASQTVPSSLSSLPEADTLVYINPQRILNDALPKVLPEKQVADMREHFIQMKQQAGIDPTKIDYVVIASRFKKPTADLNFQAGEFMIVIGGDFSAESLITLARMGTGGKLRDEAYGGKTLSLMTIDEVAKMAEQNPLLKSFSQVGIVALNANTIAAGSPAYLRSAVDAGAGNGRISSDSLNSLLRDPSALASIAGSPWNAFAKSFGLLGTEANPRAARCESKMGDFYAALTMDATNFKLRGAMNADNPDTAKIINNLISGLVRQAMGAIKDPSAQALLKGFSIMPQDDEIVAQADFPQQMVAELIRQHMMPQKQVTTATGPPPPAKRPVRRRGRRKP
ncbi:MAG TPA: hypothetical protein VGJ55_08545 [Pyrinomonadaceae bacterium]|jgi:hypothetical protein